MVWRAHDLLLDRPVAVKLLHAEVARDPLAAARFRIEAAMAAKLTHPNAVIVYDIGRDDGSDYLVMEFVEGGTLAHVFAGGPLDPGTVAGLGAQVARALGAAHHRRLVHRDVKPANVLITTEGDAKVADFGIAQALGTASSRFTVPGQVMGTARYLAPEQLRGETVDGRADVYALGVVLHEALTGEVPFGEGTMAEVASRRLVASLPAVSEHRSDVPAALDEAIARATRLDPDDRFVDGRAFAAELTRSSTPGARQELAARLLDGPSGRSGRYGATSVTADLATDPAATDRAGGIRRPSTPRSGEGRADEPTASMVPRPVPLASRRPAPADPSPIAAFADDDGADGSGSATHLDAGGGRRPARRLALVLAVLIGGGAAIVTLDRSEEPPSQADQPVEDDRDADGPDPAAEVVADGPTIDEDDASGDGAPAAIVAARDHDPFGSGEEHRAEVGNAFDGNRTTAWQTQGYQGSPELGGLKSGVGLWLDLEDAQQVAEIDVAMATAGASFTVYTGDEPPDPSAAPDAWGRPVAEVTSAQQRNRLTLEEPTEGRVWLLWFTSLPEDGSVYRATVSEVRLLSP